MHNCEVDSKIILLFFLLIKKVTYLCLAPASTACRNTLNFILGYVPTIFTHLANKYNLDLNYFCHSGSMIWVVLLESESLLQS